MAEDILCKCCFYYAAITDPYGKAGWVSLFLTRWINPTAIEICFFVLIQKIF